MQRIQHKYIDQFLRLQVSLLWGFLLAACAGLPATRLAPAGLTTPEQLSLLVHSTELPTPSMLVLPSASSSPVITTNFLLATPSPTAVNPTTLPVSLTPTSLPCWSERGVTEDGNLRSDRLPLPLEFRVHLPPCYAEQPERRYPVLYLIHGQNYNNDQWDRLGADETADALAMSGEISPFILVLPRDRNWGQPDKDLFGQVLVESLIPWIDQNFRTIPERKFRSIGGLSRGAAWAVHLGLSHWELFGSIGAHSLPVFWADTPHIRSWLEAIPLESLPRIYMDAGEKDYLIRSTRWFESALTEEGIPHEWYLFSGYHEEAYWQSHVDQYIRWYAGGWKVEG